MYKPNVITNYDAAKTAYFHAKRTTDEYPDTLASEVWLLKKKEEGMLLVLASIQTGMIWMVLVYLYR